MCRLLRVSFEVKAARPLSDLPAWVLVLRGLVWPCHVYSLSRQGDGSGVIAQEWLGKADSYVLALAPQNVHVPLRV